SSSCPRGGGRSSRERARSRCRSRLACEKRCNRLKRVGPTSVDEMTAHCNSSGSTPTLTDFEPPIAPRRGIGPRKLSTEVVHGNCPRKLSTEINRPYRNSARQLRQSD